MNQSSTTIIHTIVEQHAEDAAFLWLLRDAAVSAPNYSLSDLCDLDERTEAHIDGLRIAGDGGWEICRSALALNEPGEVFATAVLAFGSGDNARIETLIEAVGEERELARSVVSALGWLPYDQIGALINRLLVADNAIQRYIGMRAGAAHRVDPGPALMAAISGDDALVKCAALRTVGELGRVDLLPVLNKAMDTEEELHRFWAAWSSALLGEMSALRVLKEFIDNKAPYCDSATNILFRRLSCNESRATLHELSQDAEQFRTVVTAAGVCGDPYFMPLIIDAMNTPEFARVASEAFSMITGVDIAYENLEGEWPEGFEAGPTESPEDEDVALDADEDLPWPEPQLINQWWQTNKSRFVKGARYLCGEPISQQQCQKVLKEGFQRQRIAAALEFAIMQAGTPLFEVRAPGRRQKKVLNLS